jgi:hypothetical protein
VPPGDQRAPYGCRRRHPGEFVEAGYLREYRDKQVSLQHLRPVIGFMRERLGVQDPLATRRLPWTSVESNEPVALPRCGGGLLHAGLRTSLRLPATFGPPPRSSAW